MPANYLFCQKSVFFPSGFVSFTNLLDLTISGVEWWICWSSGYAIWHTTGEVWWKASPWRSAVNSLCVITGKYIRFSVGSKPFTRRPVPNFTLISVLLFWVSLWHSCQWCWFCFRINKQVGCKMGCRFCATGTMGFKSNLSSGEIVEQLVHASRYSEIRNIVFMVILISLI